MLWHLDLEETLGLGYWDMSWYNNEYRSIYGLYLGLYMGFTESRGRVVTHWPGSQKVWGSIPAATKIVRCKNLAFNIGECVSHGSDTT